MTEDARQPDLGQARRTALMAHYMMMRNLETGSGSFITVTNDAGTVIFKFAVSDSGSVATKAEVETGP